MYNREGGIKEKEKEGKRGRSEGGRFFGILRGNLILMNEFVSNVVKR